MGDGQHGNSILMIMEHPISQNKKITVMIQTRTGSSRLPSKVLAKIENRPMIWHVINRVKKIKTVQQIALITTREKNDKVLLKIAKNNKIIGFAGDKNDVLNRHYQCALLYRADPIIRITSDCPLIDPRLVEKMLQFYLAHDYDYVCNVLPRTYPDGLDAEIFSFKLLKKVTNTAKLKSDREHVTTCIRNNPHKFKIFNYKNDCDLSNLRWTVDEKRDLKFVRKIYSEMRPKVIFSIQDVLEVITKNPKISEINRNIMRNEGYLKSLKKDRIIK